MQHYYAKTKRQYNFVVKQINRLLNNNEWESLDSSKQDQLKKKLARLFKKLNSHFNSKSLVRAMGAAALVVGVTTQSYGQSFTSAVQNPFGLTKKTTFFAQPDFVDIDGDGDLDMFNTDGNANQLMYHQNTGSKTNPNFAAGVLDQFGLDTTGGYSFTHSFGDLDNDGDYDMIAGGLPYGDLVYYQNTGSATNANFATPQNNPFGLTAVMGGFGAMADFVDLDADGDLDIMATDYGFEFYFYENTGTPSAPAFAASQKNPFGLSSASVWISRASFADVDGDGDYDFLTADYYGELMYYKNIGTKTNPNFAAPTQNPFGLSNAGGYPSFIDFADLDGDSDADLMVGDYYGDYFYFKNNSGLGFSEEQLTGLNIYPNPSKGIVQIDIEDNHGDVSVEIIDLAGLTVFEKQFENSSGIHLDLAELPRGVYFAKVSSENKSGLQRLILQ
ncbi:MAG: T9SS type A sorting domain-containing protein [Schleiferiaceae bacterium]|jgi:CO dehydrogenase/acetyl-CoA synthase epsilon subunit|nr:T9SS type A sorting domain-containing protein [Schleiferiaceae bacterium]